MSKIWSSLTIRQPKILSPDYTECSVLSDLCISASINVVDHIDHIDVNDVTLVNVHDYVFAFAQCTVALLE